MSRNAERPSDDPILAAATSANFAFFDLESAVSIMVFKVGWTFILGNLICPSAKTPWGRSTMAATNALAALAKEPVPDYIAHAYSGESMQYGPEYIIPKPFDRRVLIWEAADVAEAAVNEGIAAIAPEDFDKQRYRESLEARLGMSYSVMRGVFNQVKGRKKKIVFPEGDHEKVIRAAAQCIEQEICEPILLGNVKSIRKKMEELNIEFDCEITNPRYDERRIGNYDLELLKNRSRKGMTMIDAQRLLKSRPYFAAQMVELGEADGFLGGVSRNYADVLRPCLEVIGSDEDSHCAIGCYMMVVKGRLIFLGDATVNVYPDSKTLADIAVQTAKVARRFGVEPKVAMLSFSNFGSSRAQRSERIEEAINLAREMDHSLSIDGPMQADTALNIDVQSEYPFMAFDGPANVLICPNLASANIAYKLLEQLGDAEMTGPILDGLNKPVQLLARADGVRHIVNMAAICALDAIRQESYWSSLLVE